MRFSKRALGGLAIASGMILWTSTSPGWAQRDPLEKLPVPGAGAAIPGDALQGAKIHSLLVHRWAQRGEAESIKAWVFFEDKGMGAPRAHRAAIGELASTYNPRAIERRQKRRILPGLFDEHDLPVAPAYIQQVEATGAKVHVASKWLNAVSVWADREQLERIDQLPFVKLLQPVRRGRRIEPIETTDLQSAHQPPTPSGRSSSRGFYGRSEAQLEQMNLIAVHNLGYTGDGVVVGMLDTGFETTHDAFNDTGHPLNLIAEWDFAHGDGNAGIDPGDPPGQHAHGTETMSIIGAYREGELVGGAYDASFIICKTEDTADEYPAEEDNYVAGLEFIEANGGDMATASLAYYDWYAPEDYDGLTAVTTIGINIATNNGLYCVNSAANNYHDSDPTTHSIGTPADAFQIIAVGAVNVLGEITDFSSDGPTADGRVKPEVLARGRTVRYVDPNDDAAYSSGAGTSFSGPLAAAAVACLIEAHPEWTVAQMRNYLFRTAQDFVANGTYDPLYVRGYGIIDALAALDGDCNGNAQDDALDISGGAPDCNANGLPDECDIVLPGDSKDCNANTIPDECESIAGCEVAKLVAPAPSSSDWFGHGVSMDGNVAIVGAPQEDGTCPPGGDDCGAAYVYRWTGASWDQEAKLIASDAATNDLFGYSVAISRDIAVVGAHYDDCEAGGVDCGSAYVFRYDEDTESWIQVQKLTAEGDAAQPAEFGYSVSIDHDVIVVGAHRDYCAAGNCGSAYVFERYDAGTPDDPSDDTWPRVTELTASDGTDDDKFGRSVSIDGRVIVVGANMDFCGAQWYCGSAYVFELNDNGTPAIPTDDYWAETAKLTASDAAEQDFFGGAVSVNDEFVMVGAFGNDDACPGDVYCNSGSAYVFRYNPVTTNWDQVQKLTAPAAEGGDWYGTSVSIDGEVAVVGAGGHDNTRGAAYVHRYNLSTAQWQLDQTLTASDAAPDEYFGNALAVSDHRSIVGAYKKNCTWADCGAAYVFNLGGGPDCNCNGTADVCDVVLGTIPDINHNGVPDVCDPDCQPNGTPDDWDIDVGSSSDCNENGIPDECETDCQPNTIPDECDIADGTSADCNSNGVPDECDIADSYSADCNSDGIPDECGVLDECELAHLTNPDTVDPTSEFFGASVSIEGHVAVVGVPGDECPGPVNDCGSAYIYRYNPLTSSWEEERHVINPAPGPGIAFPSSVSIDGDFVVLGSHYDNGKGAAYVYRYNWSTAQWEYQEILVASDGQLSDDFGGSVSISGDRIAVGAYMGDSPGIADCGAIYVYRYDPGTDTWQEESKVNAPGPQAYEFFGASVAIDGDLVVGAPWNDEACPPGQVHCGAAYLYGYYPPTGEWMHDGTLFPSQPQQESRFGEAVAIDGSVVLVGAPMESGYGAVYVYEFNLDTWQWDEQKLSAPSPVNEDEFGYSISLDEDLVVVGAWKRDFSGDNNCGSAYVFQDNGVLWEQIHELTASPPEEWAYFATSVSVSDGLAAIGAAQEDCGLGGNCGAAYIFAVRGEDCNCNGTTDLCETSLGASPDCNFNSIPDGCEPDTNCNAGGGRDICEIAACSPGDLSCQDCNGNNLPDECDPDCDDDGTPDDCNVLHDNGPVVSHPGQGTGGADVSLLQDQTLGLTTMGYRHGMGYDWHATDDFEVTDPQGWRIDSITFYAYEMESGTKSTMSAVALEIWDGSPDDPGSNVVFGDRVTNRMIDTYWPGIYRSSESLGMYNTDRPIMATVVQVDTVLAQGSYWMVWSMEGATEYGTIAVPVTIAGQDASGNALRLANAGVWEPVLDVGTATQKAFPFIVRGVLADCVGTPVVAPDPEPGGTPCVTSTDCTGDWIGADCVDGICYAPKNRYLSIDPTTNPDPVAYQVAVADGSPAGACMGPPFTPTRCTTNADCEPTQTCEQYYSPGIVGREWWLDVPQCIEGYNGTEVVPAPNPSCTGIWFDPVDGFDKALFGWVSRLTSAPVTRTWVEVPLQVTDCAVAPMLAYEIRASADAGGSFSDPLQINTIHDPGGVQFWGDLTETPGGGVYWPPGAAMNFDDIQSAINTFLSLPVNTGPPQTWVEMETNHVVNLGDIQFLIKAFGGTYYRDIGPFWAGPRFLIGGDPAGCP